MYVLWTHFVLFLARKYVLWTHFVIFFSSELSTLNSFVLFLAQSCGFPGEIENGWRTGYAFTYPNKVRYYCRDGFELRGLGYRDCQVDGAWSGSVPTCVGTNETLNFFIIKTFFEINIAKIMHNSWSNSDNGIIKANALRHKQTL